MTDPVPLYMLLTEAFNTRTWTQAIRIAAQLQPLAPRHPGMYFIAGIAHMELHQLPQATECLRRATVLEPARADYAVQFAKALKAARRNRDAKIEADRALALGPTDPMTLDTLGVIYSHIGEYVLAGQAFRQAVKHAPGVASYHYNLATALLANGDLDDAQIEIEACLALDPKHWLAHLNLSQLRRQTPSSHHVERLEKLLQNMDSRETEGLVCIHMALAKEREDLCEYPEALQNLIQGKGAGGDYSIERDVALFKAIEESFPRPQPPTRGHPSSEPIFIIGMPRSGTTLVERIISSHPEVHSAGELLNFGMTIKQSSGCRTSALIDVETIIRARNPDWKKLGEMYLSSTRPSTGNKPHFIDKLPHNFLYAGFIANALPHAKILCLRRSPMDTCLSNFRQLFGPNSPFFDYSFDLMDTGRYYVLFDRLMAHWQHVIPDRILEVQYEDLVDAQETVSRQIVDFCGLPWNEACLRFEQNPAPVATASLAQVRAPMYRSALGRWRRYGSRLDELHDFLRDAGIKDIDR